MKKTIIAIITVLFLFSCNDEGFIAAEPNLSWAQTIDLSTGAGAVDITYSIQNTGKETIIGFTIIFEFSGSGGVSSYEIRNNQHLSQGKPIISPATTNCTDCAIEPGQIFVDVASFNLADGIVISDVQVYSLHIWSEYKERIYEYYEYEYYDY